MKTTTCACLDATKRLSIVVSLNMFQHLSGQYGSRIARSMLASRLFGCNVANTNTAFHPAWYWMRSYWGGGEKISPFEAVEGKKRKNMGNMEKMVKTDRFKEWIITGKSRQSMTFNQLIWLHALIDSLIWFVLVALSAGRERLSSMATCFRLYRLQLSSCAVGRDCGIGSCPPGWRPLA